MKNTLLTLLILSLFVLSACTAAPAPAATTASAVATQAPAATQPPAGQGSNPTTAPQTTGAAYPPSKTEAPYPSAQPQQAAPSPYPGNTQQAAQQPYAAPQTPQPTPTFDATMGNVTGRILLKGQPVQGVSLFVAKIGADAKGNELVASFSAGESPRVEIDSQGNFAFVNIAPGRYALVLYTGLTGFLATIPGKEDAVTMTVDAGKTTDLGTLDYADLPLPPTLTPKP